MHQAFFALDHSASIFNEHDAPTRTITDPTSYYLHLSPTSSEGIDHVTVSSQSILPKLFQAFFATRSRVLKLYNLPAMADSFLYQLFHPHNDSDHLSPSPIPVPISMWELRREYASQRDAVWAVFRSHEEASVALSLSSRTVSITTALESDLEPFHKLQRFALTDPAPTSTPAILSPHPTFLISSPLRVSSSKSNLRTFKSPMSETPEYTLSSNPPNAKTCFRLGDWICTSPKCAAHNFGRNIACIGCGCPRSSGGNAQTPTQQLSHSSTSRGLPSPRFNSTPNGVYYSSGPPVQQQQPNQRPQNQQQQNQQQQQQQSYQQLPLPSTPLSGRSVPLSPPSLLEPSPPPSANPPKATHPLLTPSGRAFAVGGKVQNVSSDPLSPCVMYWPDNEPFPEQGQIRPSGLVGVAQPPILNTGNRGPISHQPGDWICQKCNYLNWRRRKVCQTCLPYAEGNGDSISAAVQAERIALLTSVLAQTQLGGNNPNVTQAPRSHSLTPPHARRPFIDLSQAQTRPVHRSQSHFSLGAQYASQSPPYPASSPIYQTSGHRQPSPLYFTGPDIHRHNSNSTNASNNSLLTVQAPAPLLPSFLQDIVQSPALSPTSTTTSSAELSSVEECEDITSSRAMFPRARGDSGSSDVNSPIANIWRLDGEESKSLSAFPLPNHQELVGARKRGREDSSAFKLR